MASSTSSAHPKPVSPSTTRVGWIGTGVMGLHMVSHLLSAGYPLTVFNRTPSKAHPLLSRGGRLAESPAALARSSDVVFLIVGHPSDVRHVILDPSSGVLSAASPGSVVVDMTTSVPSLAREIASTASSAGCRSVDAPVSGGDRGSRNASLSIFAGGDQTVIQTLAPLFNLIGKINYMGGPGLGQQAKLGNQIAIASTMVPQGWIGCGPVDGGDIDGGSGVEKLGALWEEDNGEGHGAGVLCEAFREGFGDLFEGVREDGAGPAGAAAVCVAGGTRGRGVRDAGAGAGGREAEQCLLDEGGGIGVRLYSISW